MQQPTLNDFIKELPLNQRVRAVALRKLVTQRQNIDNEQQQSIAKIKLTYQQKLKPLLQRASQIIRGCALKQEQLKDSHLYIKSSENVNIKNCMKGKVIDNYWNSVLSNSPLVDQVTQNDEKALNYLLDIQIIYPENVNDNDNISLKFVFKQNPYFNQTQIIRHLRVKNGQMLAIQGDNITWKQGKFLTHQKKKITNKKTGQSKIDKGKKIKSFFDIFLDWNAENQAELFRVGNFIVQLGNMIIMDSLDYFLGLINCQENSDQDSDEQLDQQQEQQPEMQKKVKQN